MLFHPFVPLTLIPAVPVEAVEIIRSFGHNDLIRVGHIERIGIRFRLETERVIVSLGLRQTINHADKSVSGCLYEVKVSGRCVR